MNSNVFLLIFIFLISVKVSYGQVSCKYRNNDTYGYTCDLSIKNPTGLNNFASIGGTHMTGKTNNDVRRVMRTDGSNTTNVPSIICDKFTSVTIIYMNSIGIQMVDEKAFKNCKKLQYLYLHSNRITSINEKALVENVELLYLYLTTNQLSVLSESIFKNLLKLTILSLFNNKFSDLPKNIFNSLQKLNNLDLGFNQLKNPRVEWFLSLGNLKTLSNSYNQIEELPRNIFTPLKTLNSIDLSGNKIKVIRSDPFRALSSLKTINIYGNQIEAIDEKFIDNTGVQNLDVRSNLCVNQNVVDDSTSRMPMRIALEKCFENFDDLLPERIRKLEKADEELGAKVLIIQNQNQQLASTTNELQTKVNNVTADNVKIRSEMQNFTKENEEMLANFEEKITDLIKDNEEQNLLIKDQGLEIESLRTIIKEQESIIAHMQEEFQQFSNETECGFKNQAEGLQNLENELLVWTTRPCSCR